VKNVERMKENSYRKTDSVIAVFVIPFFAILLVLLLLPSALVWLAEKLGVKKQISLGKRFW
jgi:hypothetical protein